MGGGGAECFAGDTVGDSFSFEATPKQHGDRSRPRPRRLQDQRVLRVTF